MSVKHPAPARGILMFLIGLMIASGVIRLGMSWSAAQALTAPASGTVAEVTPQPSLTADTCTKTTPEVLAAFREREELLTTREFAAEERIAALSMAEDLIRKRLTELEAAEAALAETLARADGAAEGDLTRLTSVYEAMKPKEAAALFATMDPQFAAGFLGRLRPEAAAAILSGMEAQSAYAISAILAGRNARVPTR
ncbi:MotE family protein [Falsigemmobacter faecalis]|uniref:Magnesium transporter MgtE intracellular domain-containing protein n=1 Tax=Falsigemmobacter faecalis TaxID=2488730 RepID=A0A3P3DJA5_9RHOB|nr:hypothetical protein [Falsigemmobacter faecalis]RRH74283.1 hypothetical protein EG244_11055 [Falsigemmobacter faecalis]